MLGFESIPEITPTELKARLDQGEPLLLVDVREPHEWEIADLAEYQPLRVPLGEFLERIEELNGDRDLIVYCRSGGRSAWAVRQLIAAGNERASNLKGGILAWRDEVDPSLDAY